MKAITIWQPWATLIARGEKRFETRGWRTGYRGRIAIHAAKHDTRKLALPAEKLSLLLDLLQLETQDGFQTLPHGAVVAIADLQNCWRVSDSPFALGGVHPVIGVAPGVDLPMSPEEYTVPTPREMLLGNWTPGRYVWEFANVTPLVPPIPATGQQGMWNWPFEES